MYNIYIFIYREREHNKEWMECVWGAEREMMDKEELLSKHTESGRVGWR